MSIPSPSHGALRLAAAIALALAAFIIITSWASASHGDVLTLRSTGYGSGDWREGCCTGGVISRDGRTWERFDTSTFSLAHISLPRGTEICLSIPPQADAWDSRMRWAGYTTCSYPDGDPLTIADSCWIGRGQPCPTWKLDISYGALNWMGYCDPADSPYQCLRNWGAHRTVRIFVWS